MAAIVRIKRRRDEDPKDSIVLSCKKHKSSEKGSNPDSESTVFRFAGTVLSKDEAISRTVKEAIRKEKLEKEFKQHQINTYGEIREHARNEQRQSSKKSRYKVVSNHRLLNLESLEDLDNVVKENTNDSKEDNEAVKNENCVVNVSKGKTGTSEISTSESNANRKTDNTNIDKYTGAKKSDSDTKVTDSVKSAGAVGSRESTGSEKDKKLYCLLDVEPEMPTYQSVLKESSSNQITCNSQPMEREIVSERGSDEDYVYDLYYINKRDFDMRVIQNGNLTFESPDPENWLYNGPVSDDEFVYEDEDDSNDENNWRNDYPDEYDPFFQETEDDDGDHFFHRGPYELPGSDQGREADLAEWMSKRCNIEDENELSSDDNIERYEAGPSYSSGYYRYIKELNRQDSEDETDFLYT